MLQYEKRKDYLKNWRDSNPKKRKAIACRANKRANIVSNKVLHNLKINGCAICGYNDCDAALEFHHTNPQDKKFQIQRITLRFNNEKIVEELNKCILLCANCHRKVHAKEKNNK